MPAQPIPDGFHTATPYLIVKGAASALDFYVEAFDATVRLRMADPAGRIHHAEILVGNSILMLADESLALGRPGPEALGGSPVGIMLYVEDVDSVVAKAISAGATETFPIEDKSYGDRMGGLVDPFGHQWYIATHFEDVEPAEIQRRAAEEMAQSA